MFIFDGLRKQLIMALAKLNSKSLQERIVALVQSYSQLEGCLAQSRRAITVELFDIFGVTTEKGFQEIKNYIIDIYKNQFLNTTLFKSFIPSTFLYDGREFTCDKMFYDEGCRLKLLMMQSGGKGKRLP